MSASARSRLVDLEVPIPYVYDDGDETWPKRRITSFSTIGYPTIGAGHRIYPDEQARFAENLAGGRDLSRDEIEDILEDDIERRAASTLRPKILVPITQSMWDALITQAFNTGPNTGVLSRVIEAINAKQWTTAQQLLGTAAVTSQGKKRDTLVKRRAYEVSLFMLDGEPGVVTAIPRWVWVSGISISSLLLLWGAIRVRRVWVRRQEKKANAQVQTAQDRRALAQDLDEEALDEAEEDEAERNEDRRPIRIEGPRPPPPGPRRRQP
jgi:GH24 family phage-related lysozyme (muramidase)